MVFTRLIVLLPDAEREGMVRESVTEGFRTWSTVNESYKIFSLDGI